jgi:Domain of Unknown Function (DUF1080)
MTGSTWLRSAAVAAASAIAMVLLISPAAQSRTHKKAKETPTETPTLTPTATPTPEQKVWNFDSDKAGSTPQGWKAIEGEWTVIPDPSAPSQPNTYGLEAGRLISSLTHALEYYPIAVVDDPKEYGDFVLEASFKSVGGRFDCSGGLIFRYVDPSNYYVLSAGCPSDYFAISRVSDGKLDVLKQQVVPTDKDTWYKLKVITQGGHFTAYDNDKMVFDIDDAKIAKGRIGLWARDDSEARFDNVTLTIMDNFGGEASSSPAAASSAPALPPPP